jgi:hypothetical protein
VSINFFNLSFNTDQLVNILCTDSKKQFVNKKISTDARFAVFTAAKIQVKVFWVVMPCNVMVEYQHFGGPCCLLIQDKDEGSKFLLNVGILPHHYIMSQPRRP